jgi:hypothetical protein
MVSFIDALYKKSRNVWLSKVFPFEQRRKKFRAIGARENGGKLLGSASFQLQ